MNIDPETLLTLIEQASKLERLARLQQTELEGLAEQYTEHQRNTKNEFALRNLAIAADVNGGNAEALSEALHTGIGDMKNLLNEVLNDALHPVNEETNG